MKKFLTALALIVFVSLLAQAQAPGPTFIPNCGGINDTARFQALIDRIEDNTGTIRLPYKDATRCAVNTITFPENITLDNSDGTGLHRLAGAVVTVLGPIVNPVGKPLFFGPGTTNLTGNTHVGTAGQARLADGAGGETWGAGGGGGGGVASFKGRTGTVLPADDDYSAEQLSNGVTGAGPVVLQGNPTITGLLASTINGLTITPSSGTFTVANAKVFTVLNSLTLVGGADGLTFTIPGNGTAVLTSRIITEGAGLAGNTYDLSANRTLAMGTPSTVSVSSTNSVGGTTHNHGVASSSNPGSAASLLATNSQGHLQLERLGLGIAPSQPLEVAGNIFVNAATANLFLKDTGTGFLAATTGIVSLQANNCLRSTNFTSGLVGLNICANGNAEFGNIDVRGAIHAGLIVFNAQMATAGTLGVFKSAAKLRTDVTVPSDPTYGTTTVSICVNDQDGLTHAASQLFAANDILRMKDGLTGDTWFRVASASDQTTHWCYTSTIMAGSNNATYRAGLGVADYGLTGAGFIIQTADQTNAPYLQMATHTASFSTQDADGTLNVTPRLRVGNLNGSYGYTTNVYGFGTGAYGTAGQSWLTVDPVNGVRIGNNTTVLTQVDTSGNASFVGNITAATGTIGGWTINSNRLSNGTTHIASNFDVPGGQVAWLGKTTTGTQGWFLRDSLGKFITGLAGNPAPTSPFIAVNDGTFYRIVMGGLDDTFNGGASVNSTGMKIWSAAGALLSEFSDIQNMIAGWNITTTRLSAGSGTSTVGMDTTSTGGDDVRFFAGNATPTSAPFRVTKSGVLTATNASITGSVTASAGNIGGWTISATALTAGSGSSTVGIDTLVTGADDVRIYAGDTVPTSAPFRVTEAGALTATNATITGAITATSGSFTGAITATSGSLSGLSITGTLSMSGASSVITIGTTPPTGSSTGTGIWIDRTGIFAVNASVQTARMDALGVTLPLSLASQNALRFQHLTTSENIAQLITDRNATSVGSRGQLIVQGNNTDADATVQVWTQEFAGATDSHFHQYSTPSTAYATMHGTGFTGLKVGADSAPSGTGTGALLHVTGNTIRLENSRTPASAGASCNAGEIAWDASFIYVCTATNTWKRSAIATW